MTSRNHPAAGPPRECGARTNDGAPGAEGHGVPNDMTLVPRASGPPRGSPPGPAPPSLPGTRPWVLPAHTLAVGVLRSANDVGVLLIPMIAIKQFDASTWNSGFITAAPLILAALSIFWHQVLVSRTMAAYLLILWAVASVPVAAIALAGNVWALIALWLVSSVGQAGWAAFHGELLKRLYPDRTRGRSFSVSLLGALLTTAALGHFAGPYLDKDPAAFRWILPGLTGMQLLGTLGLCLLIKAVGIESDRERTARAGGFSVARALEPVTHMGEVLRADRRFFRYEAAFMTYGIGWMVCYVLVPQMAEHKLGLKYAEYSDATGVTFMLCLALATLPAAFLNDRLGPVRTCVIAFSLYALYPLALMFAADKSSLATASVIYGIASAGVNMGWMMGPVSMAPTPAKVPQYVAIHATLVGLRGAVFQFLGVALYALTGRFEVPLAVAMGGFLWAAWQMWSLHGWMKTAPAAAPAPVSSALPVPASPGPGK